MSEINLARLQRIIREFYDAMVGDIGLKNVSPEDGSFPDNAVVITGFVHLIPQGSKASPGQVLALRISGELACATAGRMLHVKKDRVDQDVLDAVGEMSNIVAGNIKSLFPVLHTQSLPVVISGSNYNQVIAGSLGLRLRAVCQNGDGRLVVEIWEGPLTYAGR